MSPELRHYLLLANAASTLIMAGVIWIVQVVHYPLFELADRATFVDFAARHQRLISLVVIPPMLIELATAALLLFQRPPRVPLWAAALGLALVLAIWLSTFLLQVPQHAVLDRGFDASAHQVLVATNWLRTLVWSARGVLVLWLLARASSPPP